MYFWRIEKLKTAMATAPLTEREVLPYLIASVVVVSIILGAMRHAPITSFWEDISTLCNIILAVFGTLYIYQQNNGKNGQHLLQRYIAISWVVSIRWLIGFIILSIVLLGILLGLHVTVENIALIFFIFSFIAQVILYWRIGHHVQDIAQRAIAQ